MRSTFLFVLGAAPTMAAVMSRRAVSCDFATAAGTGATCSSFASSWGLSVENLQQLNPGITCPQLDTSKTYCVIGTVKDDPSSTTSTSTKPATTITVTEAVTTTDSSSGYSPTMPGIASNCDGFHLVASGDQCDTIAAKYSISSAQLRSWNSQINEQCTNLWLDYYVCVHVPGATTTPAPQPTTEPSGPTPQMPGIVANCKSYYMIQNGDSCFTINTATKTTLAQLRAWNTLLDASCSNLWLGYYICIGV